MIPGEIVERRGHRCDRSTPAADRSPTLDRASTPATGRSRSARTTTSPRPTRPGVRPRRRPAGTRLDIPAGTAVRFEPGIERDVDAGAARRAPGRRRPARRVRRSRSTVSPTMLIDRHATPPSTARPPATASGWPTPTCSIEVDRGPARGPAAGDEAVFGGGKVIRESMGQAGRTRAEGAPDLVITGAVILDHWGVVKADIGIRDGRIVAHRQGRQPRHHGRRPPRPGDRPVAPRSSSGNGKILTAGAIDSPRPPHLPADPRRGARRRHHHDHRRRHRARPRARRRPRSPRRLAPGPDAGGARRLAGQRRAARQGQHRLRRGAVGAAARRAPSGFKLHEDWGTTPGRHRRLPAGRRRDRRAGRHPHRHPQRGRVRGVDAAPRSPAGRSTPTTPRAPAAATPRTSSRSPRTPTCCRPRPTRPGRTPSTPSTSTSTC